MSFRRDREAESEWRRWVKAHEAEIIAIGIPREVWADAMTWGRFLEHGYHPPTDSARDVQFRLEDLSPDQQLRLYRFLDAALPDSRGGNVVWMTLHHRFGAAVEADPE